MKQELIIFILQNIGDSRNAIDYTFELEEKGIFYYTFYVDSDASRYLLDDDLDREEFIPSGPYLEGKITIK